MMPLELPHLYIIDPKSKKLIEQRDGKTNEDNYYTTKYQGFIFDLQHPGGELTQFIDKFLDDKLDHHYVSEDRTQRTFVDWIN